ncbi:MAG: cation diffusion facilitator family transporter [Candidatus Cloacimonadales bacterium]
METINHSAANRTSKEMKIIKYSTVFNFSFGLVGIFFAILTSSRSIMFDGLYSFVLSFFTLASARVVRLITKGQTVNYQFGYGAFEPMLIIIRSIFLFGMYVVLGYDAISALFSGGYPIGTYFALIYAVISTVACFLIWIMLRNAARRNTSPVLKAEAYGWFLDTILSAAVLLAFLFMLVLKHLGAHSYLPYIDPFITLSLVLFMLPSLLNMFLDNFRDLVSAAPSLEVQEELRTIMDGFQEKYGFVKFENYSEKRGRSLYLISHVYLDHEMPIKTLDRIRKEMVRAIKRWWFYSDIDILFTINPDWIRMSNVNSKIGVKKKRILLLKKPGGK